MAAPSRPGHHIVVDMTPLEAGGRNGGAGLVATALVRHMSALDAQSCFTLLTSGDSHAELAELDRANVHRQHVVDRPQGPKTASRLVDRLLPPRLRVRAKRAYRSVRTQREAESLLDTLQPDLLFCPFTLPSYARPGQACVSIIYDLQHLAYPEFFTAEQQLNRQHHIELAVARSQRVVCISEYVRQTLLAHTDCPPERAKAIPLSLVHEPREPDPSVLHRLGLKPGTYLLYPANFWPHKNHRRLFEALRMSKQQQLRLVCTGAPNTLMDALRQDAAPDAVIFAGYVREAELAGLLDASAALVFPSLYEGFGLPILESMARGKPILCSELPSLREVAGECAMYFDPTEPASIAAVITAFVQSPPSPAQLVAARQRAIRLGDPSRMAAQYLDLFSQALSVARGA